MASALIKFVVSFSSQDEVHKVQNLINGNGCQKWLSHSKEKTGQIEAIFQLEDFLKIAFIDVGTIWCSTIEIQVGRSDWPQDKQYLTLCPTASLMTPIDCRLKQNFNKTRMFSKEEFIDTVVREKWDRIKLILRQPYRKDVQFGVSLLKIKSAAAVYIGKPKLGLSPLDDNGRVKMIKSHFFGSKKDREPEERLLKDKLLKLSSTSENGSSELTRTAKLVLAASETTNRSYSPSHRSKENNSTARRGLFSESVAQKSAPRLEDEIVKFLFDQKLTPEDLDIITVADLRHRLEKIKKRKLNSDEKKVFMNYCQSYLVEILDGSIVSDINTGPNSGLDKQQTVDNSSTSNRKSSSGVTDQKILTRDLSRTRKSSTDSLGQNSANTLNIDNEELISGNKSASKFPKNSKNRSTDDDCLERLLSQNSRLLKSAKHLTKSAVTDLENDIVSFGDFDICDISDDENRLDDISESNSGVSSSNDAQKRSLKTPNKQCIKSQIKNCVDVSSSKKKVTVNKTKTVTPSSSISANSGSLRNGETMERNGKDIEIIDNASYGSITMTPKSSALSNLTHSGKRISQSNFLKSPKSDNSESTSARKRKRSEADVYISEGQTFIGSGKKGRGNGRGRVGANNRGHNPDSEINDSGSKKGRGRGRGHGKGRGRKSSQDSPILVTDDVWLNIGGGQVLGSTSDRSESTEEDSTSKLLPCSICNVKIKDYLLDHHFIQCSARVCPAQIDIPPLPDLVLSRGSRDTSAKGRKWSKSSSSKAKDSISSQISMCDIIYEKKDSISNRAKVNEHNSLGAKQRDRIQEQNSFAVSSSPASEDVVLSDSEDDLELLIPTLQDVLVQCPICSERFPSEIINVHTNACLDQGS